MTRLRRLTEHVWHLPHERVRGRLTLSHVRGSDGTADLSAGPVGHDAISSAVGFMEEYAVVFERLATDDTEGDI